MITAKYAKHLSGQKVHADYRENIYLNVQNHAVKRVAQEGKEKCVESALGVLGCFSPLCRARLIRRYGATEPTQTLETVITYI